jgi:hypothetical protein
MGDNRSGIVTHVGSVRLGIAIATAAFCSLTVVVYTLARAEPSNLVSYSVRFGPLVAVIVWLGEDARNRKVGPFLDFGYLLMLFWPVALPWYAFASRGRNGWKLLLGIAGLILSPQLTAVLIHAIVR